MSVVGGRYGDDRQSLYISSNCQIITDRRGIVIGDDNHMNGLDSPASITGVEEALKLIAAIQVWITEKETS